MIVVSVTWNHHIVRIVNSRHASVKEYLTPFLGEILRDKQDYHYPDS